MKVLLIYNQIPEETKFFIIEPTNMEMFEVLRLANGNILNFDMPAENEEACNAISNAIADPKYASNAFDGWKGFKASMWKDNEVKVEDLPKLTGISGVFYTGFAL